MFTPFLYKLNNYRLHFEKKEWQTVHYVPFTEDY